MKKIALVFDADNTLMRGYHPSAILEKRGINVNEFWKKVTSLQDKEKAKGESNVEIVYLAMLMHEIRYGKLKGLTIKELKETGKEIDKILYKGLPEFFDKLRKNNEDKHISYNIVSVGIKPLLEGSSLAKYMDRIFGYTFFDDLTEGEGIDEIKSTSSTAEKIPAIVSISYGKGVEEFEYPIKEMIYFGDGETDRPAFKFVKKRNGIAICVYDPDKQGAKEYAMKLKEDVNYILPADYTEGSELWNTVNEIIKKL